MISLLNKKIGSRVAHHLGLGAKEGQRFTRQAAESSIGGEGVGFSKMSLEDQNRFINRYNEQYNTPKNRSIPQRLVSQERESLTPQQKMARYESQRTVRDEGIEPALRRERQAASSSATQENTVATIPRLLLGDRVGGAVDATVNAGRAVVQGIDNLGGVAGEAINDTGNIIFSAARQNLKSATEGAAGFASHVGETVKGAASGLPYALKETGSDFIDFISPVTRGLAGDTSGRAASNASAVFQRNYEDVFSSEATAEAFGVNQNVLKQAFSQSGDDFTATLRGGGLGEDAIEGLEAFRNEVRKVADEGGNLSSEGMQAMLKNQAEVGNMYGGFSRAGATASPNALLRGMAGEGTGMESMMGIAAVAGLAGGANVMMGGEFTEGAAVGGIGALSVRGIAKGVASSMGDIEQSMIKSILGDDMVSAGSREVTKDVTSTVAPKGTRISDLSAEQMGGLKMSDVTNYNKAKIGETSVEEYVRSNPRTTVKLMDDVTRTTQETVTESVSGAQARRQNLTAIQALGDDAEQLQGFGRKQMRKLLNPNKEKNVAMNNRALVLGGGMLSGVAFTGTADRRDYRRGFNAHRGNRI
jgi:hypothetical protein